MGTNPWHKREPLPGGNGNRRWVVDTEERDLIGPFPSEFDAGLWATAEGITSAVIREVIEP